MNAVDTPSLETQLSSVLFMYLEAEQQRLIRDSLILIEYFESCSPRPDQVHDYAFVVFPLAKAYEGFLKTYFYRNDLITDKVYSGRHFRVGRSFNPDLPDTLRDEYWVYDDVARRCGEELAHDMWQVWLDARNHLFHYFPDEKYDLTLEEARSLVQHSLAVMRRAVLCVESDQ